jgi:hypothetical protein
MDVAKESKVADTKGGTATLGIPELLVAPCAVA